MVYTPEICDSFHAALVRLGLDRMLSCPLVFMKSTRFSTTINSAVGPGSHQR